LPIRSGGVFRHLRGLSKPNLPSTVRSCALGATLSRLQRPRTWVRREVVELPKSEVATAEKIDSTVGCFPEEGSSDSWFTAITGRGDGMSPRQSALSVIRFLPRGLKTGSLGRSHILRRRAVGIPAPIESGIAINAAERTDSDCAQEIPLHIGPSAMRPKHLGTTAVWTVPFGVNLHS
jgi:hypothetical protein